ncbi:MAG TPA: polynucleotide adenylyltransferase PcnB [Vicinamibacterales bacterium]|nr:polynucleotide adenylyltransferase PcnB [Vicinamibacterales bacterium]
MTVPVIVPRSEHPISRRSIDPDALKVLNRLHESNYTAYLVGGSVRDLLLDRRPKDFDIGTSAHPYQIKKLFRNCWIIGRRFRLAHVKFGDKAIEVATFRKLIPVGDPEPAAAEELADLSPETARDLLIHRDNTFGTPEEDAFRRDFTVNALFYDIADRSIIDYVGGLDDIRARVIRSIGDPNERFQEDPVRMLRAVVLGARLDFTLDPPVEEAIATHRHRLAQASPARMIEEYYKILRSGHAEKTFAALARYRLLETVTPELQTHAEDEGFLDALDALDSYRQRFDAAPPSLSNPILLGTIVVPLRLMPTRERVAPVDPNATDDDHDEEDMPKVEPPPARRRRRREGPPEPLFKIGLLPIARRDIDRLRQLLAVQRRLQDMEASPRAKRALLHRGPFEDALTWLDLHGRAPEIVEHWRGFIEASSLPGEGAPRHSHQAVAADADQPRRRRSGRRRRGGRRYGPPAS